MACSALAAYAFARLRFAGSRLVFFLFLAATMIPAVVLFIPNFILIKDLGWLNTFQGMAAPFALMTPFAVFFLRQMFLSTPRELEECALIDGASYLSIFLRDCTTDPSFGSCDPHDYHLFVRLERIFLAFPGRSLRIGAGNVRRHQCVPTATGGWNT